MTHIIPKLQLIKIHDTGLNSYTQDKIDKINANAAFAAVNPSTATMDAKRQQYADALVKADNGTRADTEFKSQLRAELEDLLTLQAADCAKIANGNMALYLASGYLAKDIKGSPTGQLEAVSGIALEFGINLGELRMGWKPVKGALNYTVWVYSDINNPDGSLVKEFILNKIGRRKTILSGLPSGQIVFIRIRSNGGSTGQGPWGDVLEKKVP